MHRLLLRVGGWLLLGLFSSSAFAQIPVVIDHVDTKKYSDKGRLRLYMDVLDERRMPIEELAEKPDAFKLFLDEDEVKSKKIKKVKVTFFSEINEPVMLGVLFLRDESFAKKHEDEESMYLQTRDGVAALLDGFRNDFDYIGVWHYTPEALEVTHGLNQSISAAKRDVKNLPDEDYKPVDSGDAKKDGGTKYKAPDFYRDLRKVVGEIVARQGKVSLPRRKILLVVTNGVDRLGIGASGQISDNVERIVKSARKAGIKLYILGATKEAPEFFKFLQTLADETGGQFVQFDGSGDTPLSGYIQDMGTRIMKQLVVDFYAPGLPSDKKVQIRTEVTWKGQTGPGAYKRKIPIPETPTNWWYYIRWGLYILGGIIGFFLFIWIIKKIARAISSRPKKEVVIIHEAVEQGGPIGPDRGKLRFRTGPLAGEIFHLTEDVTTIGCIDGNTVVIPDEGVSKRHAGIKIEEMRYELADFGSTNGTWVNGRKINKQFLRDNDEIKIGGTEMVFTLK